MWLSRQTITLLTLALALLLAYCLLPVLKPFFLAAILAYLGSGLVDKLHRSFKLPRSAGTLIAFMLALIIVLLLGLLIIPLLIHQAIIIVGKLPMLNQWAQMHLMPWLKQHFGISQTIDFTPIKATLTAHLSQSKDILQWSLRSLSASSFAVADALINLLIIIVVAFYLMRDWDSILKHCLKLIPEHRQALATKLARQTHKQLKGFIQGQLMVMIALGLLYTIGLSLVGLNTALFVGIIAGLLSFIPYFGSIIGLLLALLSVFLQFGDMHHVGWVLVVFAIGHATEGMVLTPLLVGDKIGMHPVAVLFAVLAGELLFGFTGILLAVPVAAVLMVIIRYLLSYYYHSKWYSNGLPSERA